MATTAYSALDLPHPRRSALVFAVLAVAALSLDADPRLPWGAGAVAAALFAAAGTIRTLHERRELAAVRRAADRLIVLAPHSRDASELVRWRSAELTARNVRDGLHSELERIRRAVDPARMPSASPLQRAAARGSDDLLAELSARLGGERPVSARGMLLAERLLREPDSPLYTDAAAEPLVRAIRLVLGALEP